VTFRDLGDNAAAERQLKQVSEGRHKEIASLAKLALGSLYEDMNQNSQALAIFKDLVGHPTASVGKSTAQMQLALLYESMQQPSEAAKVYQEMQKENPSGPAGQLATQKLQALKHP
jgi:predicted negative regulator of RcsB-dependent stress response